jgi:hypothetical protein
MKIPRKGNSAIEDTKIVQSKKVNQESKKLKEKYVEIQRFVRKNKYAIDMSKSIIDPDTELFPCRRIRIELEIRPLDDIPEKFRSQETCSKDVEKKSFMTVNADTSKYNQMMKWDGYFPLTKNVYKKFKFVIDKPTFFVFRTTFEKELTGGSIVLSLSYIPQIDRDNLEEDEIDKQQMAMRNVPIQLSTSTADGVSFIHERLTLSSKNVELSSPGEYIVTVRGGHKAELSNTLMKNKKIPRCSKVEMYYYLKEISENSSYDEEFASETGSINSQGFNCEGTQIDEIADIQTELNKLKTSNYVDILGNVLIPDPRATKTYQLFISSPVISVIRASVILPPEIRANSNMRFSLRAKKIGSNNPEEYIIHKSKTLHQRDISFVTDESGSEKFMIIIKFENVDFDVFQTHCSIISLRISREPLINIFDSLELFKSQKAYSDIATISGSKTVTIGSEIYSEVIKLYHGTDVLKDNKGIVLGTIDIDVQTDQVQLDILVEYHYISSDLSLILLGDQKFTDISVFEEDDAHYESGQMFTARSAIRMIGTGDVLDKGKYTLRINRGDYSSQLIDAFTQENVPQSKIDKVHFPFVLKIYSFPIKGDLTTEKGQLKLLDVEYNQNPDDDGKSLNPGTKLTIQCEFNDDLDDYDYILKAVATLDLDKSFHKGVRKEDISIQPSFVQKIPSTKNNLLIEFPGKSIRANSKYRITFNSQIVINQEIETKDILVLETQGIE